MVANASMAAMNALLMGSISTDHTYPLDGLMNGAHVSLPVVPRPEPFVCRLTPSISRSNATRGSEAEPR
ncbi:MAG: hypothetical protein HW381_504 [Candidatus Rokubacteria bacterium]|nr:hypothetical protein [Candidatus Rokubacteria bacterium]